MVDDGTQFAAIVETTSFLHHFKDLPDHRQAGKVDYPLSEVLLLILLAVLAGAEAFTDIARFGEKKLELLRRFRPFKNGTPSHDHRSLRVHDGLDVFRRDVACPLVLVQAVPVEDGAAVICR